MQRHNCFATFKTCFSRRAITAGWLAASVLCGHCGAGDLTEINVPPEAGRPIWALVGARLIDGNGGQPVENATVIIRGSRIDAVGPAGDVQIPDNATSVDLSGTTIVPGLVDCHFHSINDLGPPRTFLAHGVTTLRDPGHPFRFYQAVQQASEPMPRVFLCGAHLDAYPPIWPQQARIVGNQQQTRQAVNDHVDHGATAIKIYFRVPRDLMAVACKTARERGVPVTAHLELVTASDAIEAGVNGIEHVTSFGTSLASDEVASRFVDIVGAMPEKRKEWRYRLWAGLDLEKSQRLEPLLKQIVDHHVVVSPTLAVFERRSDMKDAQEIEILGFENMLQFVRHCHRVGATIVAGSHTWVPGAKFGFAFQRELELLVECGLTPLEAITAGTKNGARFLRAEQRLGTLEPEKLADLVVVEGKPDQDITHMRRVSRVMLNGGWIN